MTGYAPLGNIGTPTDYPAIYSRAMLVRVNTSRPEFFGDSVFYRWVSGSICDYCEITELDEEFY